MQLTCPGCGARYRIDASGWPTEPGPDGELLFRPRRARCKLCRTIWAATPEDEILELDNPLPPDEQPRPAEGAWGAVGGWGEPRPLPQPPPPRPDFTPPLDQPPPVFTPPGFTPPKDPSAPIYAAPARPPIHFESLPVRIPTPDQPALRPRLPGPGAFVADVAPEAGAQAWPPEAGPVDETDDGASDEWGDDDEDSPRRRRWPWALGGFLLALLAAFLVLSGQLRTEAVGLPPMDAQSLGIDLPAVQLPYVSLPTIVLPRAAPPPLAIEVSAEKRQLPDKRQIWDIRGTVRNPTQKRLGVPPVEILLLDAGGQIVGRWSVRPEIANLAPGGEARFETSAVDPPASARRLRVQLKPAELGRL